MSHEQQEIGTLLRDVELRLTTLLNAGLAGVNAAIVALTEAHHHSLLEQERRNGTFLTVDRFEATLRRIDDRTARIDTLEGRVSGLEQKVSQQDSQSAGFRLTATGWLFSAALLLLSILLSFLITHTVH